MLERFWKFVRFTPGCWEWRGSRNHRGYGLFSVAGKLVTAHRLSYEIHVGHIPDGLTLDHLCRNRACCNWLHLEPVTMTENCLRGVGPTAVNARKTHCPKGHEYTPENTVKANKNSRRCRECRRTQAYERWKKNKSGYAAYQKQRRLSDIEGFRKKSRDRYAKNLKKTESTRESIWQMEERKRGGTRWTSTAVASRALHRSCF